MPVRLSDLRSEIKTFTLLVGDDTLTVRYHAGKLTPMELDRAQTLRDADALAEVLSGLLVDWDLLKEDGQPLEVTKENLCGLPLVFQRNVLIALLEDMRPNATRAAT